MITRLRLKNFKAWTDSGDLALKPVTMLLGTNSSGKSSLIQSLLLLKQTVQSPDRTIHLNLGGDEINDLFNFGDFDDVLSQATQGQREFSLDFDFNPPVGSKIQDGGFHCDYRKNSVGGVIIQEWCLSTGVRRFRAVRRGKGAYSIFVDDETQPRGKGRHFAPERSITLPAEAISLLEDDGALFEDLSLAARRELERVVYLGPLRRKPERDYVWNKSNPGEIGTDGHRAIDVLLASALMKTDEQNRILNGVSHWLKRMKIADKLEVKQLGRSTRYEVVIHRDGIEANLRDVGIGVSQVLPVLTLAYFALEGSTVMFEEPEIHLHPLAQSVLAELFLTVSQQRKVQFIVETHSEHLFRRLQTLVARQETSAEETGMYFVERKGKAAELRVLSLDEYGRVQNWPEQFFGDALGETQEQAKLMFERMQGARS